MDQSKKEGKDRSGIDTIKHHTKDTDVRFAYKILNLSMNHILVHINQDITLIEFLNELFKRQIQKTTIAATTISKSTNVTSVFDK